MRRLLYVFRLWIGFAFVLGLALGASLWASRDGSINPQNEIIEKNACEECKGQNENETLWERTGNDPVALATIALVIVTGMMWRATYLLMKETRVLARGAESQAADIRKSADAATQTADIANKTLIATQRPWVNLTVELAGPLFFEDSGAGIKLKITTENTGTTPAIDILSHPMIFCRENQPYQAREIIERRAATFGVGGGMGHALFKDNKFVEFNTPSMDAREYAGETAMSPFVLVAVKYKATLGNETYMTAKLYHLFRLNPAHPGQAFVVNPGTDIPLNLLNLRIAGSHAL